MVKLDLGCGQNKQPGFVGVDIVQREGVDVAHNLKVAPWPWESESVEETFSSHFLEHLTGPERVALMEELWRVLQPEGRARFIVPYWSSMRSIQDPFHAWPPICEASFLYFNKPWRKDNKLDHYPIFCDFDFAYGYQINNPSWTARARPAVDFAIATYVNVVTDLDVTLVKKTGR